jgi:hypothetical protein
LALSRTPCAFRLRQARTVSAAESDVPCRDDGAAPSVPLLGLARPEVPKHTRALCLSTEPSRQGWLYRAPFKVTRYAQPRTPSIDSIPTLRSKVAEWVNDVRQTSTRPGHPVSRAVAARPVRGYRAAASRYSAVRSQVHSTRVGRSCALSLEKMPLANLCNRPVVTSTRWTPPFSSLGLAPFRPNALSAIPSEPAPACGRRDRAVGDGAG